VQSDDAKRTVACREFPIKAKAVRPVFIKNCA